jgi:hypothetical protein
MVYGSSHNFNALPLIRFCEIQVIRIESSQNNNLRVAFPDQQRWKIIRQSQFPDLFIFDIYSNSIWLSIPSSSVTLPGITLGLHLSTVFLKMLKLSIISQFIKIVIILKYQIIFNLIWILRDENWKNHLFYFWKFSEIKWFGFSKSFIHIVVWYKMVALTQNQLFLSTVALNFQIHL